MSARHGTTAEPRVSRKASSAGDGPREPGKPDTEAMGSDRGSWDDVYGNRIGGRLVSETDSPDWI